MLGFFKYFFLSLLSSLRGGLVLCATSGDPFLHNKSLLCSMVRKRFPRLKMLVRTTYLDVLLLQRRIHGGPIHVYSHMPAGWK